MERVYLTTQEKGVSDLPIFKSLEELRKLMGIKKDYFYTIIYSTDQRSVYRVERNATLDTG